MATNQKKKQMSDLQIMFDEAYDAPVTARHSHLVAIAKNFKLSLEMVIAAYNDYIDSDAFYAERGI